MLFRSPWRKGDGFLPTNSRLFRGEAGRPQPVPVHELPGSMSPLGFTHALGNAGEWCRAFVPGTATVDSSAPSPIGQLYVVRGCSFATPEGPHARITWRSTDNSRASEDVGFRAAVFVVAVP